MNIHRLAIVGLNATAMRLEEMAEACHILGNDGMGEKLLKMSEQIRMDTDAAERSHGEQINERFQDAQMHSAAMLATICHLGNK